MTRLKVLQRWRTSDGVDFASCVEHVMGVIDADLRPGSALILVEIDEVLDKTISILELLLARMGPNGTCHANPRSRSVTFTCVER